MATNPPASLVELVTAYFAYLFDDLSFVVARADETQRSATVVLESPECYIRFTEHEGDWEMHLASHAAALDGAEWVSAGLIYNYLTRAPVNIEESLKPRPVPGLEESLRDWAGKFKPVSAQAAAFFAPAGFAERLARFQQFLQEQNAEARRQLDAWRAQRRSQAP